MSTTRSCYFWFCEQKHGRENIILIEFRLNIVDCEVCPSTHQKSRRKKKSSLRQAAGSLFFSRHTTASQKHPVLPSERTRKCFGLTSSQIYFAAGRHIVIVSAKAIVKDAVNSARQYIRVGACRWYLLVVVTVPPPPAAAVAAGNRFHTTT